MRRATAVRDSRAPIDRHGMPALAMLTRAEGDQPVVCRDVGAGKSFCFLFACLGVEILDGRVLSEVGKLEPGDAAMGGVHEAVEDGIGDWIDDHLVPMVDRELTGHDR